MSRAKNRVLIVDDEETLTWGMSKSLSKAHGNLEVLTATTGDEALEVLEKNPIDLVITDIRMPGMDGLKLLSRIKATYPSIDVIVMTAYGSPQIQQKAVTSGSLYYIEKPFEMEEMEELLHKALKKRRPSKKAIQEKGNGLQLNDIIQINCLGKLTCALKVSFNGEEGEIYFQGGEITHARCGELVGEEAFFKLLGWQEGKFETRDQFQPPPRTIYADWQALLLRGSQILDENMKAEQIKYEEDRVDAAPHIEESTIDEPNRSIEGDPQKEPSSEQQPSPREVAPPEGLPQGEGRSKYADLSYKLKGIEGVKGAVVVAKDGVVLGSSLEGPDSSRLTDLWGATSLYLGGAISQASDLLELGKPESCWVEVKDGRLLIMEGRCLYFGLLLEEGAERGRLEEEARTFLKGE